MTSYNRSFLVIETLEKVSGYEIILAFIDNKALALFFLHYYFSIVTFSVTSDCKFYREKLSQCKKGQKCKITATGYFVRQLRPVSWLLNVALV